MSAAISTVDRVDYSNDTAAASTKGPLSLARNHIGASSSREFGIPTITGDSYTQGTYADSSLRLLCRW